MVDPSAHNAHYFRNSSRQIQDPWQWWHKFRTHADYNPYISIALEMSDELPDEKVLLRWMGEPVNLLIIPTHIFGINKQNVPAMTLMHKRIVLKFLSATGCQLAIKGEGESNLSDYVDYLLHLFEEHARFNVGADR